MALTAKQRKQRLISLHSKENLLKKQLRSLRTIANNEMKKVLTTKGVIGFDSGAFLALINDDKVLSSFIYKGVADKAAIRSAIRNMATYDIGAGHTLTYEQHLQIEANLRKYNAAVDLHNKRLADAIASGEESKRYHKYYNVLDNPAESQESVNEWASNILTFYGSSNTYWYGKKADYLSNFRKAMDRRGKLSEAAKDKMIELLGKYVSPRKDYLEINEYYDGKVILEYEDIAIYYGFSEELRQWAKDNPNDIPDFDFNYIGDED